MTSVRVIWGPPAFGYDMAVAQQHEAMNLVDLLVRLLDESEDGRGGNALGFGTATRQREFSIIGSNSRPGWICTKKRDADDCEC